MLLRGAAALSLSSSGLNAGGFSDDTSGALRVLPPLLYGAAHPYAAPLTGSPPSVPLTLVAPSQ